MGLYIVKQIIEAHGGEVSVASIEGQGTSMVVRVLQAGPIAVLAA